MPRIATHAASPGTVNYVGRKREAPVRIQVMEYHEDHFQEKEIKAIGEILPLKNSPMVTWVNVTGVHDTSVIESIGDAYGIHSLVLEDIANTTQRPKLEEYDGYLFAVVKMTYIDTKSGNIIIEQLSLIIGQNYILSFQEKEEDVLNGLRQRIRTGKGRIRKMGSDYLLYAILDSIVDFYFTVLEQLGDRIEDLEETLLKQADQAMLNDIYHLKQDLIFLRKSIWPMREVISSMQHAEHKLITKQVGFFLRDAYDHTIQVIETVETFRDMASGMQDLYLSTISNKMNEVMKVLTIFAAIFIPLTFLAGVYGMNFHVIPELSIKYGYFAWWGVVLTLGAGMLIYFKRKKWL
ncbi:MAG: magnesium/cobalt transporter CorA [Bacteroidales bacterium]|nr:magnesium/cobalt transporter CorA [Bacteroidales bacterium]